MPFFSFLALLPLTLSAQHQLLGFSPSDPFCVAPPVAGHMSVVFAFSEFSFAAFSKMVGAYDDDAGGSSSLPALQSWAGSSASSCQFELDLPNVNFESSIDGSDVAEVMRAINSNTGSYVIRIASGVGDLSASETKLIEEVVTQAREKGGSVFFTEQGQARRNLASKVVAFDPIRMSPELFLGLLLVILSSLSLISFFCCCMDGIVTESRYAKAYPQKGKEFN